MTADRENMTISAYKGSPASPTMTGAVDYVMESAAKGYGLIKKSARPLFITLLKVHLFSTAIGIVGLLLMLAAALVVGGSALAAYLEAIARGSPAGVVALSPVIVVAAVVAVIIWLVSSLLSAAARSVAYNAVGNTAADRPTSFMEQFRKNMLPVMRLSLILWAAFLVLGLPMLVALSMGESAAGGMCIFALLSGLAMLLFAFFSQFSVLELVMKGGGAVDSIKTSFFLVRGKAVAVLLLDLVIVILALAVSMGTTLAQNILEFVPDTLSATGLYGLILGYSIFFVLLTIFSAIVEAVADTLVLPMVYHFWAGAEGEARQPAAKKPNAKKRK